MERMHVTSEQALNEPNEVVEAAFLIWKLDDIRASLKEKESKTQ